MSLSSEGWRSFVVTRDFSVNQRDPGFEHRTTFTKWLVEPWKTLAFTPFSSKLLSKPTVPRIKVFYSEVNCWTPPNITALARIQKKTRLELSFSRHFLTIEQCIYLTIKGCRLQYILHRPYTLEGGLPPFHHVPWCAKHIVTWEMLYSCSHLTIQTHTSLTKEKTLVSISKPGENQPDKG